MGLEGVGSLVGALGVEGPAKGGLASAGEAADIAESIASNWRVSDLTSWNARSSHLIGLWWLLTIAIAMVGCRRAIVRKRIACLNGARQAHRPFPARIRLAPHAPYQHRD